MSVFWFDKTLLSHLKIPYVTNIDPYCLSILRSYDSQDVKNSFDIKAGEMDQFVKEVKSGTHFVTKAECEHATSELVQDFLNDLQTKKAAADREIELERKQKEDAEAKVKQEQEKKLEEERLAKVKEELERKQQAEEETKKKAEEEKIAIEKQKQEENIRLAKEKEEKERLAKEKEELGRKLREEKIQVDTNVEQMKAAHADEITKLQANLGQMQISYEKKVSELEQKLVENANVEELKKQLANSEMKIKEIQQQMHDLIVSHASSDLKLNAEISAWRRLLEELKTKPSLSQETQKRLALLDAVTKQKVLQEARIKDIIDKFVPQDQQYLAYEKVDSGKISVDKLITQ